MSANQYQIMMDGGWVGGVDSLLYPTDLTQGCYKWAVNIVNRGGVVQTRPSKRRLVSFCGRKAQGHHWVRTMDDRNYEMIAVDGRVYWSAWPFNTWQDLGLQFSPLADRLWFCTAEQAIVYNPDNTIGIIEPKNIVVIQDGTSTPGIWDLSDLSSELATVDTVTGNPAKPIPIGTAMIWQDNRLWLVIGNLVFASDLLYPQSFNEDTYLAEQSGFRFPRGVVNLFPAPVQGILVFTDSSMHTLMSFVQDRTQWQTTQNFQADVNLEVGLVGPWAFQYLHGMPWFLTTRGIISYDRALTQNLSTVILTVDGEMARSKQLAAPDVTHACLGVWENMLLVAFPASSLYNRHTWILDAGIAEKLNNPSGVCWSGIWTGSYPVQFTSPIINGTQHNYELSYSSGFLALNAGESPSPQSDPGALQSNIHLWENYMPNMTTGMEPTVHCSWESRAYILATDDYYRFVFAEIMVVNLKGIVPVQVYVMGLAGNYQPLFSTTLRADVGIWGNPTKETILYYISKGRTTEFETYRRQVRHLRTQEFIVHESPDAAACTEIQRLDGVDKAFVIMIQWQGRMGIRMLKFFYDRQLQSPLGSCPVDESDTPHITIEATA